ncbi:MAG: hypothetical protein COX81_02055 [Candidatus Magasanikbacteria bacterium CG_4_10_14_0_2_um_filter_37_12]|uniref:Uncharacterized protein n=1 Tax=Candidatus Magasanikbacteria bacterium CG_4_10_14_0_2_um_filter_37_12 TaxID=1974637 RepID=A0A2M7V8E2_9BACT|nr:MAG: hypothetical protein COX81_02055 [Candidatus Magasanikbacteria bacterium CG_4_10_14_0_2_um_filter_37_12]
MESKRIIVDLRHYIVELTPNLTAWRNKNIAAVYNDVGVEKFAFINDEVSVKQDDSENTFVTNFFKTIEEAEIWALN